MPSKLATKNFHTVNIPQGTRGTFAIQHKLYDPGHVFETTNSRTALIGGHKRERVRFPHATRWHLLTEGDGVWMSDYPIEQLQHDRELLPVKSGRVLVGGLGLGYAASMLARRPRITEVVVVEKAAEVIDLVASHLCMMDTAADHVARRKLTIVHDDLFAYLQRCDPITRGTRTVPIFDHAFYDIWASDGESTFLEIVVPLFAMSRALVRTVPINWNESVMRGQLYHGLTSRYMLSQHTAHFEHAQSLDVLSAPRGTIWADWCVPFFQWVKKASPEKHEFESKAALYAAGYGRPSFANTWRVITGIDVPAIITTPSHFAKESA